MSTFIGWGPDEFLCRRSHAILAGGRVWITDAVDEPGIDERIRALGEPAAVVQLLDRHGRDSDAVAARLGVPHHVTPFGGVPDAPFEVRKIAHIPSWHELALWFPAERVLVTADALGSVGYFRAPDEPFGVHPMLRLWPPKKALGSLEPAHLLFGHGEGYHRVDAPAQLRFALNSARRRLPAALLSAVRRSAS